jgi:hypothetical protein
LCCVAAALQRELELIAEALRIPGSKSLGPVSKVRQQLGSEVNSKIAIQLGVQCTGSSWQLLPLHVFDIAS